MYSSKHLENKAKSRKLLLGIFLIKIPILKLLIKTSKLLSIWSVIKTKLKPLNGWSTITKNPKTKKIKIKYYSI